MVKNNSKSASVFVSNMCTALYGTETLLKSTTTGKNSNRSKEPKPDPDKLEQSKLYAIKSNFPTPSYS